MHVDICDNLKNLRPESSHQGHPRLDQSKSGLFGLDLAIGYSSLTIDIDQARPDLIVHEPRRRKTCITMIVSSHFERSTRNSRRCTRNWYRCQVLPLVWAICPTAPDRYSLLDPGRLNARFGCLRGVGEGGHKACSKSRGIFDSSCECILHEPSKLCFVPA